MEHTSEEKGNLKAEGTLKKQELKMSDLRLIRTMKAPPQAVKNVFTCIMLLLENNETKAKDWNFITRELSKSGKESIVSRCSECKPENVTVQSATLARSILEEYSAAKIKCVSSNTLPFFVWSKLMADEVLNAAKIKE